MRSAYAVGARDFMPVAAWASERWGWRAALLIPSVGALLSWLLFMWLARDRPQELGLPPLGGTVMAPMPPVPKDNFVQLTFQALAIGVRVQDFHRL
jgi:sugar phosphate permease